MTAITLTVPGKFRIEYDLDDQDYDDPEPVLHVDIDGDPFVALLADGRLLAWPEGEDVETVATYQPADDPDPRSDPVQAEAEDASEDF
jgi:hypothetical protein